MAVGLPIVMRARANELDEIADDLGDNNHLFFMVDWARREAESLGLDHLRLIDKAARAQQGNLREKDLRPSPTVYQDRPDDHTGRIAWHWKLAMAQQD